MVNGKGSVLACLMAVVFVNGTTLSVNACTDFLIKTTDDTSIVGRSMEWGVDLQSHVWQHSRGETRSSTTPDGKTGATWKSKYGYLGLDADNMPLAIDGINEAGFSLGLLWMPGTVYQDVPAATPAAALSIVDIGHWLLGNFKTVDEAKAAIGKMRVWAPQLADWGGTPTAHLALHDAQGNSAVIEFVDGKQVVYDNPGRVLTNAPTFDWHRTNVNNYVNLSAANAKPIAVRGTVLAPPGQGGGFLGIPGDWTPPSRFIRTTAMLGFAKAVKDAPAGVILAQHILNAVDIPLGDVRQTSGQIDHSDYTQWIVVKDLTNRVLYFRSYDNLTLRAIDLKKLNFAEGIKSQMLTPVAGGNGVVDITSHTP